jgi:hypothetical protein
MTIVMVRFTVGTRKIRHLLDASIRHIVDSILIKRVSAAKALKVIVVTKISLYPQITTGADARRVE